MEWTIWFKKNGINISGILSDETKKYYVSGKHNEYSHKDISKQKGYPEKINEFCEGRIIMHSGNIKLTKEKLKIENYNEESVHFIAKVDAINNNFIIFKEPIEAEISIELSLLGTYTENLKKNQKRRYYYRRCDSIYTYK
jgi:hypothetical protein